jgi:hypothetical protein
VSRIWKSELRLDLRIGGCQAELRGAGWKRRLIASASAVGTGAAAIGEALGALQLVDEGVLLPSDARLTVADEYVCYALLDSQVSTQRALDEATLQFSNALGRDDLVVQISPLPAGNGWLAAAVLETDLHAWADALADAGIRLEHVHPALVSDLSRIANHVRENDAAIALVRDNGATLVRLEGGVPAALAWEPFDIEDRGALDRRLHAFVRNTSAGPLEHLGRIDAQRPSVAIYLYTGSKTLSLYSAVGQDEVLLGPRRHRSTTRSGVGEQIMGTQDRTGGSAALRAASSNTSTKKSTQSPATLAVNLDSTVEPPRPARARRPAAGNPGAAALAALAAKLRLALDRSRARRDERRRAEAQIGSEDDAPHKDFSLTGSVLPDEWQDTVQAAEVDTKNPSPAAARPARYTGDMPRNPVQDKLDLLEAMETERALELAFMREDEIPASAWRGNTGPAASPQADTTPGHERRRRQVPAALVWPPPTLEVTAAVPDVAPRPLTPGSRARPADPQPMPDPPADAARTARTADLAGAYDGADRRRSHRA